MQATVTVEPFRFSAVHRARLVERFGEKAHGLRFIGDLQKLVAGHLRIRQDRTAVPAMTVIRANAGAIQKAARQLTRNALHA